MDSISTVDVGAFFDPLFRFKSISQISIETGLSATTIRKLFNPMALPPDPSILFKVLACVCFLPDQILDGVKLYGYNPDSKNLVLQIYLEAAMRTCSLNNNKSLAENFDELDQEVQLLRRRFQIVKKFHLRENLDIKARLEKYNQSCDETCAMLVPYRFTHSDAARISPVCLIMFVLNNLLSAEEAYDMFDELAGYNLSSCSQFSQLARAKALIDRYASVFPEQQIRKERDVFTLEEEISDWIKGV